MSSCCLLGEHVQACDIGVVHECIEEGLCRPQGPSRLIQVGIIRYLLIDEHQQDTRFNGSVLHSMKPQEAWTCVLRLWGLRQSTYLDSDEPPDVVGATHQVLDLLLR